MVGNLVAVTGATGALGGRVARRLADRGVAQRLVVRDPDRAPVLPGAEVVAAAYADGAAMRLALAGVDTLLLVSATEANGREAVHRAAVDAAIDAGVRRIVYTSFFGAGPTATFTFARHHWDTEQYLRERGVPHTILRNNLYLDVLPAFVGPDLVLRGPAADGRVAGVARDDIADATAAVLTDTDSHDRDSHDRDSHDSASHDGRTYSLTGAHAFTLHDAARDLSVATGRAVTYHPETVAEAYASRAHYGAPDWEVEGWVSTYTAIAAGEMVAVTDDVARLAGHPPMSFAEYLDANPHVLARLTAVEPPGDPGRTD